jgi:lysophospholipase L1-like esterase
MMKHIIASLCLVLSAIFISAQTKLQVTQDTVRVINSELKIGNSTKDIGGYLFNTGGGVTKFKKIEIGKSVQFNVGGAAAYPKSGDSIYTNADFINRNVKVWRNGIFQYRAPVSGIKSDSLVGQITFRPALESGEKIYIEALTGVDLIVEFAEDTTSFQTNLTQLVAGLTQAGSNFTLRWATNNLTLSSSPRIVGIGSSTLAGYGLSSPNRLGDKISTWLNSNTVSPTWINLGVGGYTSTNLLPTVNGGTAGSNIDSALGSNPDFIFVCLPSNDAGNGISVAQSLANYRVLDGLAKARGIPIFFETTQPRSQLNAAGQLIVKQLSDSVRAAWPDRYVEGFLDLVDNSASTSAVLLSQYDQGDGIHLNASGNQLVANRLFARWSSYFKTIKGVQQYVIESSSNSIDWSTFETVTNQNTVKKTYTRTNDEAKYFRAKAFYVNGTSSAYSNVVYLPPFTPPASGGPDSMPNNGTRFLVDLGGDGSSTLNGAGTIDGQLAPSPDASGKYWNNWTGVSNLGFRNGSQITNLVTTANAPSYMSITLLGAPYGTFSGSSVTNGINFNGFNVGVGDYPQEALYDNMFFHNTANAAGTTLRLKGLQPGATYFIKLWGARVDAAGVRVLEAKLGSQAWTSAKSVNTRYLTTEAPNYAQEIVFSNISGMDSLDINVRVGVGSTFAHISLIDIRAQGYQSSGGQGTFTYKDTTVGLPTSSVQLLGDYMAPGVTVTSYNWSQSNGPNTLSINNLNSSQPTLSGLTNGAYTMTLSAVLSTGQTVNKTVKVVVTPDNGGLKTMRVHFSLAATAPIPGWVNAYGNINTAVVQKTDSVTGWAVSSAGTTVAYWNLYGSGNSVDNAGQLTGNNSGVVPDIALANYWFNASKQFTGTSNLIVTGLNPAKSYTIKLVGSRNTSAGSPRYAAWRINGGAEVLQNAQGNTSLQYVQTNVSPDSTGKISIGVFSPVSGTYGSFSYINALTVQEQ